MTEPELNLTLAILREIRAELRDHRTLLLQLVDANRRQDRRFDEIARRISDTREETELMLKGELLGRLTHFETRIDDRPETLAERVASLEGARG